MTFALHTNDLSNSMPATQLGLTRGTRVMTLTGIRSVETLKGGDRIITRSGARVLRSIEDVNAVFQLEFDTPQVVLLEEGQVYSDTGMPFAA